MPYTIQSITPRGQASIPMVKLTVLVGPNNSGKSQTLKDIHDYVTSGSLEQLTLLEHIADQLPALDEVRSQLQVQSHSSPGHSIFRYVSSSLLTRYEFQSQSTWIDDLFTNINGSLVDHNKRAILGNLGGIFVAHLGAEARFRLSAESPNFDARQESPSNALQAFFQERRERQPQLRSAFQSAFGMDIGLDWAAMTTLYLRVAGDFGAIPDEQLQLDDLMRDARALATQGDGYRSFAGVALALLTFPKRFLLLDEPEAFLHPAQARILGKWLAKQADARDGQVVVATHSADFLAGVVEGAANACVIRLNRRADSTNFHVVPSNTTRGLVTSPLLSSQPVLDSLFHRGVVVCEGDPDRAVYQTVAHKLLRNERAESILFIHSNGKDAIKTPARLLRESLVPVCAIADFDVLSSATTLGDIYEAVNGQKMTEVMLDLRKDVARAVEALDGVEAVSQSAPIVVAEVPAATDPPAAAEQSDSLARLRQDVTNWTLREHGDLRDAQRSLTAISRRSAGRWDRAKARGLDLFDAVTREKTSSLLGLLARNGVFVVPSGELESWFDFDLLKGSAWNRRALESLHEGVCPDALHAFVTEVTQYLVPPGAAKPAE